MDIRRSDSMMVQYFEHFNYPALYISFENHLIPYSAGIDTAITVLIGHRETEICFFHNFLKTIMYRSYIFW